MNKIRQYIEAAADEKRASIRAVNKALKAKGYDGYELVKDKDYFYFDGPDTSNWRTSSVHKYKISDLTVKEWVKEFESLKKEHDDNYEPYDPNAYREFRILKY